MNLLTKIQNKLKGEPETQNSGSTSSPIEELNKLPDQEKIKVLDYLKSVNELHTITNEQ